MLKDRIQSYPKLFNVNGGINSSTIKINSPFMNEFLDIINEQTSYLNDDAKISERIFNIINGKQSRDCQNCGMPCKFTNAKVGYRKYCSSKCSTTSKEVQSKIINTTRERYGVDNVFQSEEIKNKIKNTCLDKHGDEFFFRTDKFKNKTKETNTERYGVEFYSQTDEYIDKVKKTNMQNLGVEFPGQAQLVKNKAKNSKLERYGDITYNNRSKAIDTMKSNYNVQHYSQITISEQTINRLNDRIWLINEHHIKKKSLVQIANDLGDVTDCTVGNHCRKLDIEIKSYKFNSLPEQQIVKYITDNYDLEVIQSNRTILFPREIDIFLPSINVGIEFNGYYWHSPAMFENDTNRWLEYHQSKVDLCNKQNIQLLHLWEDYGNHQELIDDCITNGNIVNDLDQVLVNLYGCS